MPQYTMIKCIDDILKIKTDDKTKEICLVPENNNLAELLFQLLNIGYEPRIKNTGIIDEVRLRLNKITYIIKTQNLIKSSGDGWIAVSNETTYNNINKAMFNFNKSLFISSHKSFYNDSDIKILNETVFNQFDHWKKYNDEIKIDELHELTLYYVETIDTNVRPLKTTMDSIKELIEKNQHTKQMIYYSIAYRKGIDVATYIEFRKTHDLSLFLNPDELKQAIRNIVISGNHNLFFNKNII